MFERAAGNAFGFLSLLINIRGKTASANRIRTPTEKRLAGGARGGGDQGGRSRRSPNASASRATPVEPDVYFTRVAALDKKAERARADGFRKTRRSGRYFANDRKNRTQNRRKIDGKRKGNGAATEDGGKGNENAPRSSERRGGAVGGTSGTIDVSAERSKLGDKRASNVESRGETTRAAIKRRLRVRFLDGVGAIWRVDCGAFRKRVGCVRQIRVLFRRTRALSRRIRVLFRRIRVL